MSAQTNQAAKSQGQGIALHGMKRRRTNQLGDQLLSSNLVAAVCSMSWTNPPPPPQNGGPPHQNLNATPASEALDTSANAHTHINNGLHERCPEALVAKKAHPAPKKSSRNATSVNTLKCYTVLAPHRMRMYRAIIAALKSHSWALTLAPHQGHARLAAAGAQRWHVAHVK